jgi:hypothetical protein
LIVAMHHSPYFFSTHFTGSPCMLSELQSAINLSRRVPNVVLSATAHAYERVDVTVLPGVVVPFFTIGTGGHPNLFRLGRDISVGSWDRDHTAELKAGIGDRHGFATLQITTSTIAGTFTAVPSSDDASAAAAETTDRFSYSATPIELKDGQNLALISRAPGIDDTGSH